MAQPTHKPNWPILGRSISPGQSWPGVKISLWKFYRPISSYLCDTDWRFMLSKGKNKPNNQIDFFNSCFCDAMWWSSMIFQYLRYVFVMFQLNPESNTPRRIRQLVFVVSKIEREFQSAFSLFLCNCCIKWDVRDDDDINVREKTKLFVEHRRLH